MKNNYIKTAIFATLATFAILVGEAQQAEPCGMKQFGKVKSKEWVISQTDPSSLYLTNFNGVIVGEGKGVVNFSKHAFLSGHENGSYGPLSAGTKGFVVIGVHPDGKPNTFKLHGDLSSLNKNRYYSLALKNYMISGKIQITNVVGQIVYHKGGYYGQEFVDSLANLPESKFWEWYRDDDNGLYCPAETTIGNTNLENFVWQWVEGGSSKAIGKYSHAEGRFSIAEGRYSHAEGQLGHAAGVASHVEGQEGHVTGSCGHAEGIHTEADAYAHSEGAFTKATGNGAHAEGGWRASATSYEPGGQALGSGSHAEGIGSIAIGTGAHAEGYKNVAKSSYSHAEGGYADSNETHTNVANGVASHVEGLSTQTGESAAHAEGLQTKALGRASHAEGSSSTASGFGSHVEGYGNIASGYGSHAEGGWYYNSSSIYTNIAAGAASHAEGISTKAEANASHAEGYGSKTSGDYSHAEGKDTFTKGTASHAEGIGYRTQVSSYKVFYNGTGNAYTSNVPHNLSINNIIEVNGQLRKVVEVPTNSTFVVDSKFSGTITNASVSIIHGIAYGNYSHSEGGYTYATAENSHAEGDHTKAYGKNSHAEGSYTTASGEASFAGGKQTTSTNTASFAEGFSTKAYGMYSHAGGWGSEAHTIASFAFGYMAKTSNNIGEIALGKNNISSSDTIFYVGTGSDAQKKNGLEVKNNNDIYFWHKGQYVKLQDKISSIPSSVGITSVTTNGTSFSVNNGEVTIPLDNYVLKSEIKAQAQTAKNSINTSANLSEIKAALTNFLQQTFVNQ